MDMEPEEYIKHTAMHLKEAKVTLNKMLEDGTNRAKIILDVGCGVGNVTALLASTIQHDLLLAIDISEAMIKYSSKFIQNPSIQFHVQDIARPWDELSSVLTSLEGQIDLVFSNHVLHYVEDEHLPAAAKNIYKLLSPGGKIYIKSRLIVDWNETLPEEERLENEKLLRIPSRNEQHAKWKNVFLDAGFDNLTVEVGARISRQMPREELQAGFEALYYSYCVRYLPRALATSKKRAILEKFQDSFERANTTPIGEKVDKYRSLDIVSLCYGVFFICGTKKNRLS